MKKIVFIGVWILGLSVFAFAQPNLAPSCPKVSVSGPRENVQPNVAARYTATIDTKGRQFDLKYFWNVTAGTIVSGQGTTSIEVVQTRPESQIIAVEIKGLPGRCPDTASLLFSVETRPEPVNLAQLPESACPTITMTGPTGLWKPGEVIQFAVSLEGNVSPNVAYAWSISYGEITEGQGTTKIAVRTATSSMTATIEIKGLPNECQNVESETAGGHIGPVPLLVDESSIALDRIGKRGLDKLAEELKRSTNSFGYIIEYLPVDTRQKVVDRKIKLLTDYLTKTGRIDPARFKIVFEEIIADGSSTQNRTKLYAIPPGADNPTP